MVPGDTAVMNTSCTGRPAVAALRFAMSFSTAAKSFHAIGALHAGRRYGLARRAAYAGNSRASRPMGRGSSAPPNPCKRSRTYVAKLILLCSPSLTTATPTSTWRLTFSVTARWTVASKTPALTGWPSSLASSICSSSGGRARLPVWVVKMRSVLRFICLLLCTLGRRHGDRATRRRGDAARDMGTSVCPHVPVSLPYRGAAHTGSLIRNNAACYLTLLQRGKRRIDLL